MASEQQVKSELGELFGQSVAEHQEVMAECLSILRMYSLTPQTLYFKYEAMLLALPSGLRAKMSNKNVETFRQVKKELQREQQTARLTAAGAAAGGQGTPQTAIKKTKTKHDLGSFLDNLTPSRPSSSKTTSVKPLGRSTPTTKATAIPQRLGANGSSNSSFATPKRPLSGSSLEESTPLANGGNGFASSPTMADSPLTQVQAFSARTRATEPIMTLNAHLGGPSRGAGMATHFRTDLAGTNRSTKDFAYRYMFEKISQRSEALDKIINESAEAYKQAYGLTELGDPHYVSETPVYTVGRILSLPTDSGRPTAQSMLLESSRHIGAGKRIPLRFAEPNVLKVTGGVQGVKGFGCWPGAIVCVRGRNGGGGSFVVDEVLQPVPAELAAESAHKLLDDQYGPRLDGQPVGIMVAAGPYTLETNLDYEPLEALIETAIKKKPDVLILIGPFVDSLHPLLRIGAVNHTPQEIFRNEVSVRLAKLVEMSPATKILLSPSVRDMVSRHLAFPQGALERAGLGVPKAVNLLPNPYIFTINEISIGLSSVDVLFHLRKEEYYQRAEESEPSPMGEQKPDVMAGLCRHVLGQRSFYPIFPSPEAFASEVNLDVTHEHLLHMDGTAPDILILPSKLQHFAKIVDGIVVVNPAYLSRPKAAGTYAYLTVFPLPRHELENSMEQVEHRVYERVRCDIERI